MPNDDIEFPSDLTFDRAVEQIETLLADGNQDAAEKLCAEIGRHCSAVVYAAGVLALTRGAAQTAADLFRAATLLAPGVPDFHLSYARALLDRQKAEKAMAAAQTALDLEPSALAHNLLGRAYFALARHAAAKEEFAKAVELEPADAATWSNLGAARLRSDDIDGAIGALRRALEINANFADAWVNLGRAYAHQGLMREAIRSVKRARDLSPDAPHVNSALLFVLTEAEHISGEEVFVEHQRWGTRLVELVRSESVQFGNDPGPIRPIRVGYVSGDFHRHPVAFFVAPLLTLYDRKNFRVACYSNGSHADQTTWQMRSNAEHWVDLVGRSDEEVAALIRADQIDILVDLSGHTAGNRLGVFARRAAPVQVTYVGYVATTGLSTMDYRLTDLWSDPVGETERFFTETLVRPFESFICYVPPTGSPGVEELPALRAGHITFASFNRARKINGAVIDLWSRVLQAVPGSRLLLKPGPSCDKCLLEQFAKHGVADRVDIGPFYVDMAKHLASYSAVDIALDTFPWNGITTTCEALWMGVPVLALAGREHRSRAGVSILHNVGIESLIAETADDYVALAVRLSSDIARLRELRGRLRAQVLTSPLMDAARFTRAVEGSYREMWKQWCERRA